MQQAGRRSEAPTLVTVALLGALLAWAALGQDSFRGAVEGARAFLRPFLQWYYVAVIAAFLCVMVGLGVSRFRSVRLGQDGESPEYSLPAWLSMLFAAGTGVGLLFWSIAEPLRHLAGNPFALPETGDGAVLALRLAFFHWGLSGWAIFALIGLCLAYFSYRHDRPLTLSAALEPLIGARARGWAGHVFDVLAVLATVFGVVTTLGLGAEQMASGLGEVFGLANAAWVKLSVVAAVIAVATLSVAAGLQKGVRRLSEFNIFLAFLLLAFFFVTGPGNALIALTLQAAGAYLQTLPRQSLFTAAEGGADWLNEWTVFYWGWWIAWAPFVGMFIARISRGRTIGEFLLGVFVFPTLFTFLWFGVLGGTALHLQETGAADLVAAVEEDVARALFVTVRALGAPERLTLAVNAMTLFLIAIFFATSADSGTLVVNTILSGGRGAARWRRVSWSLGMGALTAAMILAGGVEILQQAVVLAALPFSALLAAMAAGLIRTLSREGAPMRRATKRRRPRQPWTGEDAPD